MKRYQKIQEHIAKLEVEDNKLELAMDDAYNDYFKTIDKKEVFKYFDNLREQRREVNIHLRVSRENLIFADTGFSLEDWGTKEYSINTYFNDDTLFKFYKWLKTMMKEVE